jgi:hypothetical protein
LVVGGFTFCWNLIWVGECSMMPGELAVNGTHSQLREACTACTGLRPLYCVRLLQDAPDCTGLHEGIKRLWPPPTLFSLTFLGAPPNALGNLPFPTAVVNLRAPAMKVRRFLLQRCQQLSGSRESYHSEERPATRWFWGVPDATVMAAEYVRHTPRGS